MRPTQAIEIFGNVLRHLVPWSHIDIQVKFYGDRPRGTHPSGELNTRRAVVVYFCLFYGFNLYPISYCAD